MTIYGTPGGTPSNTSGFQGTSPGNAVGATLPGIPPNMSVHAAVSAGLLPANALFSNAGKVAAGGRTLPDAMARAGEVGYNGSAGGFDSLNSDANGGSGPGAGQANQTEGPSSGQMSLVEGSAPATAPTITSPVQYGG